MAAEYFVCQMPVRDEGKSCTDSDQCQDICKANAEDDTNDPITPDNAAMLPVTVPVESNDGEDDSVGDTVTIPHCA